MKKIFAIILIVMLFNYSTISSKEPTSYYKLPEVYKQSLNTSLEGNNYLYPIKIDGEYGFIDINGKLVIEPKFALYMGVSKGYYLAYTTDEEYVVDETNSTDPINATYLVMPNSKVVKISDGNVYAMLTENKKYAMVDKRVYSNGEYINKSFIFDLQSGQMFDESNEAYEIVAAYDDCYITKASNKHYMKSYAKKNLSAGYESFVEVVDGTYFFESDKKLYFLDKTGNPHFQYEDGKFGRPFYKDIAPIIDKDNNLKFLDKNKKVLYTYDNVYSVFKKDNFYVANAKDKMLVLNYDGSNKLPDGYKSEINYYTGDGQPISAYNKDTGVFDVFDENGNIKRSYTIPKDYTNVALIGNYVLLSKDMAYGIGEIKDNKIGWILEPEYSSIHAFDAYYMVSAENFMSVGIYDLDAKKFILEPKYRSVYVYDENMIYVQSAYFEGYVNPKGQFIYVQQTYSLDGD